MIRSAHFSDDDLDLVPMAIVGAPLAATLAGRGEVVRGWDDLDWYDGADFVVGRHVSVALRHYDGHPPDTFTIYVDRTRLSAGTLALVLRAFGIATHALTWVQQANGEVAGRRSAETEVAKPKRSVA